MSVDSCVSDDLIEMTPPTARTLAQQERKRLAIILVLLGAIFSLCIVALSQLSTIVTTYYPDDTFSFLP